MKAAGLRPIPLVWVQFSLRVRNAVLSACIQSVHGQRVLTMVTRSAHAHIEREREAVSARRARRRGGTKPPGGATCRVGSKVLQSGPVPEAGLLNAAGEAVPSGLRAGECAAQAARTEDWRMLCFEI